VRFASASLIFPRTRAETSPLPGPCPGHLSLSCPGCRSTYSSSIAWAINCNFSHVQLLQKQLRSRPTFSCRQALIICQLVKRLSRIQLNSALLLLLLFLGYYDLRRIRFINSCINKLFLSPLTEFDPARSNLVEGIEKKSPPSRTRVGKGSQNRRISDRVSPGGRHAYNAIPLPRSRCYVVWRDKLMTIMR
jgi:hypothetical protein